MTKVRSYLAGALAALVVVTGARATGQVQRSPATLDDVLAEIKGCACRR